MEVVGEVYIHEMEVLHDSCRECSKILPRACGSKHVSDHVTVWVHTKHGGVEQSAFNLLRPFFSSFDMTRVDYHVALGL